VFVQPVGKKIEEKYKKRRTVESRKKVTIKERKI
jgi:hypothetical protein